MFLFGNALRISAMKILRCVSVFFIFLLNFSAIAEAAPKWKLVWSDEFNGAKVNSKYWSKIERGTPDWKNTMSKDPSLFAVKNGKLILRGKVNRNTKKDPSPFITGGLSTQRKVNFCYGKLEIRAKLDCAQGAWPALWLLPDTENGKWPDSGEIDLMEHLNFDDFAYQTVHSRYTYSPKGGYPPKGATGKIKRNDYNIYTLEWYPNKLVFFINGKETFTYPRLPAEVGNGQWPFDKPFYILVDMQLGGSWVGKVNPDQLPVEMYIDWVRLYRDTSRNK